MPDVRGALAWRYRKYVTPRLELHGSLPLLLARKISNRTLWDRSGAVYVYAGRGNVGDYLSHLGVRAAVGLRGPQFFSGEPGNGELVRTLASRDFSSRSRVLVIGGGGLFQRCFSEFWQVVLNSRVPYVVFGVGANRLGDRRDATEASLLAEIVRNAAFVQVRDSMTLGAIAACGVDAEISVGLCPSTGYLFPHHWHQRRDMNTTLLHVVHPSDLRLAGGDLARARETIRAAARDLGLSYAEEDNVSADLRAVLRKYDDARIVVSSRLHGCIISHATGVPFVPVRCDDKIDAFLSTHAPGVVSVEVDVLHEHAACRDAVGRALEAFDASYRPALERGVQENLVRGARIREAIVTETWGRTRS